MKPGEKKSRCRASSFRVGDQFKRYSFSHRSAWSCWFSASVSAFWIMACSRIRMIQGRDQQAADCVEAFGQLVEVFGDVGLFVAVDGEQIDGFAFVVELNGNSWLAPGWLIGCCNSMLVLAANDCK